MKWAHVREDGLIDWISDVEQDGLIQLDLPVLEARERMWLKDGALFIEKEEGSSAEAVVSSFVAELEEARAAEQAQALSAETSQAVDEAASLEEAAEAMEAETAETSEETEEGETDSPSLALLFRLLAPDTALPSSLFPGRSFTDASEFTGDFADWRFLNCEPSNEQKAFIASHCRGRKFDALFLTCPYHGQRVSFSDILVGTDKAMLHKDILAELEAAGIATSGLEFRAALFRKYCTAHCGVFRNGKLQEAVPDEAAAESLAEAALSLLNAGEETRAILKEGI